MRPLTPSETTDLDRRFGFTWTQTGDSPTFTFAIGDSSPRVIGFFLIGGQGQPGPTLFIDEGQGFSDLTSISMKGFPVAFYHYPLGARHRVRRIAFRPGSVPATFKFCAFSTRSGVLVGILHYLFNLRYQNVGVFAPAHAASASPLSRIASNAKRIFGFFLSMSRGGGVRSQVSEADRLVALKARAIAEAEALQARLDVTAESQAAPLLSFVTPTYNTKVSFLDDLLESFASQKAPYAELILSDDGSTDPETVERLTLADSQAGVTVLRNTKNRGIAAATNAGIAAARGAWLSFIDHDDVFVTGAFAVILDAIQRHPDAVFFYTDEIITDGALTPLGMFCKPSFDSVLLSGMNYINHLSIFRSERVDAIGGLRNDRDGSQDYDLLLRYLVDVAPHEIVHIPYPAYLWRREEGTYSQVHLERAVTNARAALKIAYGAPEAPVDILPALDPNHHRIDFHTQKRPVSVVILNKDSLPLIRRIVDDLRLRTASPPAEIVIVDNGTRDPEVLAFYERLRGGESPVVVDVREEPFNFARMCNRGAALARNDLLLFLNNDIEVLEPGWLDEMVACLQFKNAAIIGAKLLYPNGRVQHNGVIVGLGDAAGHWYVSEPADSPGPMGRFNVRQTLTAVTGACMLMTRACFDAVGGFDDEAFPIAYNDVDLCLRARALGFRTIWTPFACLRHHESATRGSDETGENNIRFRAEFSRFQDRHGTVGYVDDAYSPFFDRRHSVPHTIVPPELPAVRENIFP